MTMFGNAIGLSPGNLGMKLFQPSAAGFVPVDVPQAEADCLIALYNLTDGDNWTVNTNWLVDTTVGNWFGITVVGGHVTQVLLNANNLIGSLATWSPDCLPSLTHLYLHSNAGLIGDLSGWTFPAGLFRLFTYSASFTGDLSGWTFPATLQQLYLNANSFTGDLSGWTLPAGMTRINVSNNLFTGDLSGWMIPAVTTNLELYANGFTGTPDISANIAMRYYYYFDNALIQANVDAVLLSVYNRRMAFTWATPTLNVGGTNLAPSGIYQAMCPPTTGKEYAFELVNDSCGDGFNKWTVTFTP